MYALELEYVPSPLKPILDINYFKQPSPTNTVNGTMHHFLASVTQSILINAIKKPTLYGIYVLHEHYTVTNPEK